MNGLFNEMTYFNGVPETVADILKHYDDLGGPNSYPHYAAGWAVAGNTPFTWTKQVAGTYGGCRNPWSSTGPRGSRRRAKYGRSGTTSSTSRDRPRSGRAARTEVGERCPADAHRGVSMLYTFADAKAKDTRKTQYFEIFGNRGIYHDGWLAHRPPRAWEGKPRHPFLEDVWHLYHVDEDFSSANDLAAKNPEKLKALQELFLKEAAKNHALPLDDRSIERMNAPSSAVPS